VEDAIITLRKPILLADIGGTNARFALLAASQLGPIEHLAVKDYRDIDDAIATFLSRRGGAAPSAAILGVAGTVEENRCDIVNSHWRIDGDQLQPRFGFEELRVINDFEALAWSLPRLVPADLLSVGDGSASPGSPMVVIGPGTGLGAGCLITPTCGVIAIGSEAGHATLPSASRREDMVIDQLRKFYDHVSAERALSGSGLENLYRAIAAVDGVAVPQRDAPAITAAAQAGTCPVSRAALDTFCAMLGTVAGNLALTFRARGGVFIAGGMVPQFSAELATSDFRARFEAKGRFQTYLAAIPTSIILRPDAAFLGLQAIAENMATGASVPRDRSAPSSI
jgi:glucokinase